MSDNEQALPAPGASVGTFIQGPAGGLEALIASPPREVPRGIAVICHPHPLYGGAMSNKVVWTLASSALKSGLLVARFNFRGVGGSEGSFDNAMGETDDAIAVVEWLRLRAPGLPLLLAGFSFGGYVSIKAANVTGPAALVTVAPPFGHYVDSSAPPPRPPCPWLVVHSIDDDTVAFEHSRAVLDAYEPPPELSRFEHAGHFFHGQLGDLQGVVQPFVERCFSTID